MSNKQKTTESQWFGRSLDNYKSMHYQAAEKAGVVKEFSAAMTLTKARRILFGVKTKHFSCCTNGCGSANCPRATRSGR